MTRSTSLGLLVCLLFMAAAPARAADAEHARWLREAAATTIVRDDWGIAHVHGGTDADAVFGAIYAEAEDDFNRVEANYITALGRNAEVDGEGGIWGDLRMRLFIDPVDLKARYASSPPWLKTLMIAWADGLNFYLERHPAVKPRLITRFEPWMALSFTEGSIGGDIERVNVGQLAAFYGAAPAGRGRGRGANTDVEPVWTEPTGSNGVAIAPSNTLDHHALLYINPHTSFYFRSELQMSSDEGLDAYGAVTWGQFFIYQGFNATAGWMHTSSGVDNIDEFLETVTKRGDGYVYKHGNQELPVRTEQVVIPYKTANGMETKTFTAYYTMHGPVVRKTADHWVSISLMKDHIHALIQSYGRTKSKDYTAFLKFMDLHTNSSNNTIFADAEGNIAYLHSNYIPRRDTSFDWTKPVDGSNPATDYHGVLSVNETPHLLNPASGWLYNSNNWPWSAAGPSSPRREDYPKYVETGTESARGLHAIRVLQGRKDFTLAGLLAAAFDSYQTWFEKPVPALIKAWDAAPASDPLKAKLADLRAYLDFLPAPRGIAVDLLARGANVIARFAEVARGGERQVELVGEGGGQPGRALGSATADDQRWVGALGRLGQGRAVL